jgi:hypothetical protein
VHCASKPGNSLQTGWDCKSLLCGDRDRLRNRGSLTELFLHTARLRRVALICEFERLLKRSHPVVARGIQRRCLPGREQQRARQRLRRLPDLNRRPQSRATWLSACRDAQFPGASAGQQSRRAAAYPPALRLVLDDLISNSCQVPRSPSARNRGTRSLAVLKSNCRFLRSALPYAKGCPSK